MYIRIPVGVWIWVSLIVLHLSFGDGSLSEPGAHQLKQDGWPEESLESLLSLLSNAQLGLGTHALTPGFDLGIGDPTRVLMLHSKYFLGCSIFQSLSFCLSKAVALLDFLSSQHA